MNYSSFQKINQITFKQRKDTRPKICVKPIVRNICSVYITKGRINNTASKLIANSGKCKRIAKQLQILQKRFKLS